MAHVGLCSPLFPASSHHCTRYFCDQGPRLPEAPPIAPQLEQQPHQVAPRLYLPASKEVLFRTPLFFNEEYVPSVEKKKQNNILERKR